MGQPIPDSCVFKINDSKKKKKQKQGVRGSPGMCVLRFGNTFV